MVLYGRYIQWVGAIASRQTSSTIDKRLHNARRLFPLSARCCEPKTKNSLVCFSVVHRKVGRFGRAFFIKPKREKKTRKKQTGRSVSVGVLQIDRNKQKSVSGREKPTQPDRKTRLSVFGSQQTNTGGHRHRTAPNINVSTFGHEQIGIPAINSRFGLLIVTSTRGLSARPPTPRPHPRGCE